MKKRWMANVGILLVILLFFTACSSSETSGGGKESTEPIVLGASLALTGGAGYLGEKMKESFDLVIEKKNDEGGINGRKIEVIYYDDENKPEKAVQNVQKL